ncbi:MAG: aromatic-ring-hydroxylating dioxygenase subunit beta [Gammaproteobacteria bacterium]
MTPAVTETEYRELSDFLYDEAEILSNQDYAAWERLLAEDIHYLVPVPQFMEQDGGRNIGIGNGYFDDDIHSMRIRLQLLGNPATTTSENIRSLLNHVVTNIRVTRAEDNEYQCRSCITIHRTRFSKKTPTIISGRRTDLIRRTENGFQLVKREVKLTQSILMSSNISFFF